MKTLRVCKSAFLCLLFASLCYYDFKKFQVNLPFELLTAYCHISLKLIKADQ